MRVAPDVVEDLLRPPTPRVRHDTLNEREKVRARRRGNQMGAAETSTRIELPPPAKRVSRVLGMFSRLEVKVLYPT